MIERRDLLAFDFYKRKPFLGSYQGMRYRVEKVEIQEETKMQASIWPEPFSYENTDADLIVTHLEEFNEDGLCAIVDWLNSKQAEYNS